MKYTKKQIAKLLNQTPNVSASLGEITQFFRSPQYNEEEQNEGNIIEDFLVFRGLLDKDIVEVGQ